MKKLNIILILLGILVWGLFFSITAKAQYITIPSGSTVEKEPYNYIIEYWGYENRLYTDNGSAWNQSDEIIHLKGFHNLKELLKWLNEDGINCWNCSYQKKDITLKEDRIIQIVDLIRKEEIELVLKKETKVKKREVIIEEDTWEDKWYEIKKQYKD